MSTDLLREKLLAFAKENKLVVFLGFVGLIFLGYGLIVLLSSNSSTDEITFESASENSTEASSAKIVIDIEGAVVKPGVYSLVSTGRIQDALIAAGGLSQQANREWVTKNINLAAKLTDGAKIYIPLQGESGVGAVGTIGGSGGASGSININIATESQLDTLSGVGPVTAQKIIAGRPYNLLEDLVTKKIISSSVFGKIKDKISLY